MGALEAGRYGHRVNSGCPGVVPPMGTASPASLTEAIHRSFAVDRTGRLLRYRRGHRLLGLGLRGWITGTDRLVDSGTNLRRLPGYVGPVLGESS